MSANPSRKLLRRRLLAEGRLTRKPTGTPYWRVLSGARTPKKGRRK